MDINPLEHVKTVTKIRDRELEKLNTRNGESRESQINKNITKTDTKSRPITESQIQKVVEEANQKLTLANTKYRLMYNKEKGRFTVKVFDKETNEEVGEIPSENVEKLMDNIWEITGLIIDKKVWNNLSFKSVIQLVIPSAARNLEESRRILRENNAMNKGL